MNIKRLTTIGDGTSLDENLRTRSVSKFTYTCKRDKQLKEIIVAYRDNKYYFWKNSYDNKEDLRKDITQILITDAILLDSDTQKIDFQQLDFQEKPKISREKKKVNLKEIHGKTIREIQDKILFWSNPKLQSVPLGVGGIGLVGATLLPGGLGFLSVVAGGAVLFMGGEYIGKKIDKYKLKLEKLKKIHY